MSATAVPGAFFSANSSLQQFLAGLLTCRFVVIIVRLRMQENGFISVCVLELIGSIPYMLLLLSTEFNLPIVWLSGLLYDQLSPFLHVYIYYSVSIAITVATSNLALGIA
jgi:hypothetical protein